MTEPTDEKKPAQGGLHQGQDPQWREEDLRLIESLKRFSQNAYGMPPLAVERRFTGTVLQLFQDSRHLLNGNQAILYQWSEKGGKYLGRSCAVGVHDVGEMCRLLETFFKVE